MGSEKIKITFNPSKFNNVYWHLLDAINNPAIRYIWLYGGSSASKSYSVVQLTLTQMLGSANYNTMVMRKVSEDIKDSIFSDFKGIISDWEVNSLLTDQQNLIKCKTGSYCRFRGLDDSEKIKGLSNFKKVILEEVSQFEHEDFKQIRKRLRGKDGQQIISIFNPIIEQHWIKKEVFDIETWNEVDTKEEKVNGSKYPITGKWINEKGNSIILKTNYTDNKWIVGPYYKDQHVIDDYEWDRVHDFANYEIYALGNWGKITTGGEFYKNFKREKHVGKTKYDSKLPLHLSFDENTKPYFPCGVFQIVNKEIRLIDEILAKNPNNTTTWMAREIERRYWNEYKNHNAGMFIYGDATSRKDDVKQEKGVDLFRLLENGLQMFKPHRRVAASNPSVRARGDFFNDLLAGNPKAGGIEFIIDEHCSEAINDFYMTKEASDGGKDKREITDKATKERYQPHGHITDLTDYMLCYAFKADYETWQRGGAKTEIMYQKTNRGRMLW